MAFVLGKMNRSEVERVLKAGFDVWYPSREQVETLLGPVENGDWDEPPQEEVNDDPDGPPTVYPLPPEGADVWGVCFVDSGVVELLNAEEA